ncbi:MAG TPA: c-type cytochrome [Gammaproteobacteria bacterium]|nr:c-type cytochrome [Gammaproteobacteria bacterium]
MRSALILALIWLSPALLADDGHALYQNNCGACHGLDGHGGVGIPLALASFQAQASDDYLARTIRHGRPGRIMPRFTELTDNEIKAIIRHIRSWQPGIKPPVYHDKPIPGNTANGKKLFDRHCSSCHGVDAVGGHGTGVMFSRPHDLPIVPPALNNSGFLASATDAMIHRVIEQGRHNTPMPAAESFGISPAYINDIVAYIRQLRPPQSKDLANEPAALIADSPYSYDDTIARVKAAAVGMNFRLIRDQALDGGLVPEGKESKRHMMVYFCNFKFLYDALAIDPRVGLFLPCRVTVIETAEGDVKVMSINPRRLSQIFNNNELDQACEEMHKLYASILDEATL